MPRAHGSEGDGGTEGGRPKRALRLRAGAHDCGPTATLGLRRQQCCRVACDLAVDVTSPRDPLINLRTFTFDLEHPLC